MSGRGVKTGNILNDKILNLLTLNIGNNMEDIPSS